MSTNTHSRCSAGMRAGALHGKHGVLALALSLALAGCGGGGDDVSSEELPMDPAITSDSEEQQVAAELAGVAASAPVAVQEAKATQSVEQMLAEFQASGAVAEATEQAASAAVQGQAAEATDKAAQSGSEKAAQPAATDATAQKHGHTRPSTVNNPVYRWNELALDAVRAAPALTDTQAARLYAMVNVAMYDAVNGIETRNGGRRAQALVSSSRAPRGASLSAAASAAARAVLTSLRPDLAATYQAQHDADIAALRRGSATTEGAAWGAKVGREVVDARQNDGSSPNEPQPAGTGVGQFRAAWNGTQFRNLAPFAISKPSRYVPAAPPALASRSYADSFEQTRVLGSKANDSPQFLETFQFWASNAGTSQPAGEWIKVALLLQRKKPMSLPESARLMALLGMALSDAVAPTITAKVRYHSWRPFHAIGEGDQDGNTKTTAVSGWQPRGGSIGGSPEYVSGHSSFAGAGTTILRGFFCQDDISFTLQTDGSPNGARRYRSFSQVEAEAGLSRILGGVHFPFSNEGGLVLGRGVAKEILATALLRTRGETHHRGCPK
jgi:hypothetical protein